MPLRPCLDCSKPTQGNRCPPHQAQYNTLVNARRAPNSVRRPDYGSAERTRRAAAVAAHRARHGDWCPGWGKRAAHQVVAPNILTADHIDAVGAGGAEGGAYIVRCRSCNSARGAKPSDYSA